MPSRKERKRKAQSVDLQWASENRLRIKKHKLEKLRNDKDFITAVRIGRILNALLFSSSLVLYDYDWKKAADRRRWPRVFQLYIGYLHEALGVFESIESKYSQEEFYAMAKTLINPKSTNDRWRKKLLKLVRDSSFHLDKDDKVTTKTLSTIPAEDYLLLSSDDGTIGEFHFDFADEVDMYHMVESFRTDPNQSHRDLMLEIGRSVSSLGQDAIRAGDAILNGLLSKLNLKVSDKNQASRPKKRALRSNPT